MAHMSWEYKTIEKYYNSETAKIKDDVKAKIEPIEIINKITINEKEIEANSLGNISVDVTDNDTYKIIAYGKNETYNMQQL